jgi:hypothetical protein
MTEQRCGASPSSWKVTLVAGLLGWGLSPAFAGPELKVAIHDSAASRNCWTLPTWKNFHANQFLKEALAADGIPFVVVSDSDIANGDLLDGSEPRYPILFSLQQECISNAVATGMADYYAADGMLYLSGSSGTRTETGAPRLDGSGNWTFALGAQLELTPTGWIPIDVAKVHTTAATHPYVDHLPDDVYLEWQMPSNYHDLRLVEPHQIWGAKKTASGNRPAHVLMSAAALTGKFNPLNEVSAGTEAISATETFLADADGDGRSDLIYRVGSTVKVQVYAGQSFLAPISWGTFSSSYDLQVADVDGDGKADLIGRNPSNSVTSWALSTGTAFSTGSTSVWSTSYTMLVADVDGDGDGDVVGKNSAGDVQVGLWTGSGYASSSSWATVTSTDEVVVADVTGDGKADLVSRQLVSPSSWRLVVRPAGSGSFGTSATWGTWPQGSSLHFADADEDGRVDVIQGETAVNGRMDISFRRSVASPSPGTFATAATWLNWPSGRELRSADLNGDGMADLLGFQPASGNLHIAISAGVATEDWVKLAERVNGGGRIAYNAEPVPLAGHGGFANDNSEYKTIRRAIDLAFALREAPLISLGTWPYGYDAAIIARHDHHLSLAMNAEERLRAPGKVFGEYYIWPPMPNDDEHPCYPLLPPSMLQQAPGEPPGVLILDVLPEVSPNGSCPGAGTDYPHNSDDPDFDSALIGAHVIRHTGLDAGDGNQTFAEDLLATTLCVLDEELERKMDMVFVAPSYEAIAKDSMVALWESGFLTTGEQGIGPFPHFSLDPQLDNAESGSYPGNVYIGTLLQLPISEIPDVEAGTIDDADNQERMADGATLIEDAVDLSHELGGLINVYDHAGGNGFDGGCQASGADPYHLELLKRVFDRAFDYQDRGDHLWATNSLEIRDWWLQRASHQIVGTSIGPGGSPGLSLIRVALEADTPLASTPTTDDDLAIEIELDPDSATYIDNGLCLALDGVQVSTGGFCPASPSSVARCVEESGTVKRLIVRVGGAETADLQLGSSNCGIWTPPPI